jgi:hypothetical protein
MPHVATVAAVTPTNHGSGPVLASAPFSAYTATEYRGPSMQPEETHSVAWSNALAIASMSVNKPTATSSFVMFPWVPTNLVAAAEVSAAVGMPPVTPPTWMSSMPLSIPKVALVGPCKTTNTKAGIRAWEPTFQSTTSASDPHGTNSAMSVNQAMAMLHVPANMSNDASMIPGANMDTASTDVVGGHKEKNVSEAAPRIINDTKEEEDRRNCTNVLPIQTKPELTQSAKQTSAGDTYPNAKRAGQPTKTHLRL